MCTAKKQMFSVLESCLNIPKDDRLLLRKHILQLKDLSEDRILHLLADKLYQKQPTHKLQVLIRKYANDLRKREKAQFLSIKTQELKKQRQGLIIENKDSCLEKEKKRMKNQMRSVKGESLQDLSLSRQNFDQEESIQGKYEQNSMPLREISRKIVNSPNVLNLKDQFQRLNQRQEKLILRKRENLSKHYYSIPKKIVNKENENEKQYLSFSFKSLTNFTHKKSDFAKVDAHQSLKSLKIIGEEFFDFLVPASSRKHSPCQLYIPYYQLINKLNSFLITKKRTSNQESLIDELIQDIHKTTLLPFKSQNDFVTIENIEDFLNEYFLPELTSNPVRNIFTRVRIGVESCGLFKSQYMKKVSISQFERAYSWKNLSQEMTNKFRRLVHLCNPFGNNISMWEVYWVKESKEFKDFYDIFYAC